MALAAHPAYYVTAAQIQSAIEERPGVLSAPCIGQGYPRGSFPYQRYHLFLCYVRTQGWTTEYHFQVTHEGARVVFLPTMVERFRTP